MDVDRDYQLDLCSSNRDLYLLQPIRLCCREILCLENLLARKTPDLLIHNLLATRPLRLWGLVEDLSAGLFLLTDRHWIRMTGS